MMFCRAAWQRLAPLARKTFTPLSSNAVVPVRQMSFGIPASGTNIAYMVLCGSSLTAALVYAYKIINSDTIRYNEKIAQMEARSRRVVGEMAVVAEEAVVVETAAAELTVVEARATEPVVEVVEAEQISESVDATMEVEAATAIVQAVAAEDEESTAPVVEDLTAEAQAPITETSATTMSDLMSTVKILAGSTVEIAAASVGDQHLVAAVRLAEDNSSEDTLNGVKLIDIKADPADAPEEAEDRSGIDRSHLKTEGEEYEEMPSALHTVEDTADVVDDHVSSEEDSYFVTEAYIESEEASGTDLENIMEESTSAMAMVTEDESISGAAQVMSKTFAAEGQKMEGDTALCHDPACRESEHAEFTTPPIDLEETLQSTTETTGAVVIETVLDAVEEAKPAKASDEAVENGNVTMIMAQA